MSPDVLSPQAKKWGFQMSLQERLFYDYDRRKKEAKQDPNVIYLTTNYRSNEQILQFSSDMFYGQLSCGSSQPLHPWLGPLVFYSAFGKEEMAENHSSHRNLAEVNEVVKRVKELMDSWPQQWGSTPDPKQVAVVSSERYQVQKKKTRPIRGTALYCQTSSIRLGVLLLVIVLDTQTRKIFDFLQTFTSRFPRSTVTC